MKNDRVSYGKSLFLIRSSKVHGVSIHDIVHSIAGVPL